MHNKAFLFFIIMLGVFSAATFCYYEGPDSSEDQIQLSDFKVSGDEPVYVGEKLDAYFNMTNIDKIAKSLGKYGINIRAKNPSGGIEVLGYDFSYYQFGGMETLEFDKKIEFDEPGLWIIWPSYHISGLTGESYGPDYWHSCNIEVEKECGKGCECLTEGEAKKDFEKYEKCDEDPCGYVYENNEPVEEKYCFKKISEDSDGDGVPDEEDRCIDEPETFNSFMDADGCPDEVPQQCPEGLVCRSEKAGEESGYSLYYDEKNQTIICDYLDYQTPMYCYERREKPDLVITGVWFNGSHVKYTIKNIGGEKAGNSTSSLYADGVWIVNDPVGGLEPSEESAEQFSVPVACNGQTTTIKVVADTYKEVDESNEQNNEREEEFDCEKGPDLIIKEVWYENTSCGAYRIKYIVENIGEREAQESTTTIMINNESFDSDPVSRIGAGEESEESFSSEWTPEKTVNTIVLTADAENNVQESNEENNVYEEEKEILLGCCPPCQCLPSSPNPIERGYKYCHGVESRCGPNYNLGSLTISFFCYILPGIYENYPCPPMIGQFGYGSSSSFEAEFSGWDGFAVGDVLGDGMDEVVIARDDSGGTLQVYAGNGTLLLDTPVRYTKYDRLAVGDVLGDEKEEIIIAVDDDAPGDDGRIYIYQITGSAGSYALTPVMWFDERFTPYDALMTGKLLGGEKEQIAIAIDEDNKLYVYDVSSGTVEKQWASFPVRIYQFRYTDKANGKTQDEIAIGDVLVGGYDEIVFIDNKNDFEKSSAYTFRYVGNGTDLQLIRKVSVPFTKYDGMALGDVVGDKRKEILIGIDETRSVYIIDAMSGLLKVHYRRWTKYDGIGAGHLTRMDKEQCAIAIDEDDRVYIGYDEELMGVGG